MEVINGRIDAFIYDFPFNAIMATTHSKNRVVHLADPFTFEPLGWAIRRGNTDFLNWLNHFLRQVKNDGTYDQWFKSKKWQDDVKWSNRNEIIDVLEARFNALVATYQETELASTMLQRTLEKSESISTC